MKKSQEKYPYRLNCPTISVNIASSIGQIYPYHMSLSMASFFIYHFPFAPIPSEYSAAKHSFVPIISIFTSPTTTLIRA